MNIGEVARSTGLTERMIRHYEKLGLMPPAVRSGGGYRDYSPADVERLGLIAAARDVGLPFADVADLLSIYAGDDADAQKSGRIVKLLEAKAASLGRVRSAITRAGK